MNRILSGWDNIIDESINNGYSTIILVTHGGEFLEFSISTLLIFFV